MKRQVIDPLSSEGGRRIFEEIYVIKTEYLTNTRLTAGNSK